MPLVDRRRSDRDLRRGEDDPGRGRRPATGPPGEGHGRRRVHRGHRRRVRRARREAAPLHGAARARAARRDLPLADLLDDPVRHGRAGGGSDAWRRLPDRQRRDERLRPDGRDRLGARLRRRDRLRPAARLALPRRAAPARGQGPGDERRARHRRARRSSPPAAPSRWRCSRCSPPTSAAPARSARSAPRACSIAMLASLTLLPALLLVAGRRAFWPLVPRVEETGDPATRGFFRGVGERVSRRPRTVWIVTAARARARRARRHRARHDADAERRVHRQGRGGPGAGAAREELSGRLVGGDDDLPARRRPRRGACGRRAPRARDGARRRRRRRAHRAVRRAAPGDAQQGSVLARGGRADPAAAQGRARASPAPARSSAARRRRATT